MAGMDLRNAPISVPCPRCGCQIRTNFGRIADQATVICPNGHHVRLVDCGHGVRQVDQSLRELERTLRRIGRR